MSTLSSFEELSYWLEGIGDKITEASKATMIDVAIRVSENLENDTPILTGMAKSNFIVSEGEPVTGIALNSKYSVVEGPYYRNLPMFGQATEYTAYGLKSSYKGGSIYITNNLPYASSLNAGTSSQAPPKYIQAAVSNGIGTIKFELK